VTKDPSKIDSVISEKRIKLHVFEPSQRKIEQVEPDRVIGLWKGVSKDDLSTIPL